MNTKRLRHPKLKNGELCVYWGQESKDDAPDIIFAWKGEASMRRDIKLIVAAFTREHPDPFVLPIFTKMLPCLADDLEARGYDLTTLKFSIQKKAKNEN